MHCVSGMLLMLLKCQRRFLIHFCFNFMEKMLQVPYNLALRKGGYLLMNVMVL